MLVSIPVTRRPRLCQPGVGVVHGLPAHDAAGAHVQHGVSVQGQTPESPVLCAVMKELQDANTGATMAYVKGAT